MIKYILFDLDGTLLNSNDIIFTCFKHSIKKILKKEIVFDDLVPVLGGDLYSQMKYFSQEKHIELVDAYRDYYNEQKETMVTIFPGVIELLQTLKNKGFKLGITTSKGKNGAMHGIKMFEMDKYLDFIITGYEVENNKPHPESIYRAQEFFNCSLDEMIIIGDSEADINCGKNAGIKNVLVSWTLLPKEKIKILNPDYVIDKPEDLYGILLLLEEGTLLP